MVAILLLTCAGGVAQAQPLGRYVVDSPTSQEGVQELWFEPDAVSVVTATTTRAEALGPVRFTVELRVPLVWEDDGSMTLPAFEALTQLEVLAAATVGAVQTRRTSTVSSPISGGATLAGTWKVNELSDGRLRLRGPESSRPLLLRPAPPPEVEVEVEVTDP